MGVTERLRERIANSRTLEPVHEAGLPRPVRAARRFQSVVVFLLLDLNDRCIARFQPEPKTLWDTADWPWIAKAEQATPAIRAEIEQYANGITLPHVAALSGLDPESPEGKELGVQGTWRAVVLFSNGRWVEEVASHFPITKAMFTDLHPKANVGFSALEPHSHIEPHVGPNRGALRFQLPLIVPGELGDCRIRVGDEMVRWEEGHAVVFDLSTNHEAWNDTDELRVLLMVELAMPLPLPWSWLNRWAQYCYRWHPAYRGMPDRIAEFGRRRDEALAGAA